MASIGVSYFPTGQVRRGPRFFILGGNEFRLRQGFACGKTLVRRFRAAPLPRGPVETLPQSYCYSFCFS